MINYLHFSSHQNRPLQVFVGEDVLFVCADSAVEPVGHGWLALTLRLDMDNLLWQLNLFSDLLSWYMPEQAEC